MDMTPQEYQEYVKRLAPKSPIFKDTAFAFFIGGAICALGQLIQNGFLSLGYRATGILETILPLCRKSKEFRINNN